MDTDGHGFQNHFAVNGGNMQPMNFNGYEMLEFKLSFIRVNPCPSVVNSLRLCVKKLFV